MDRFKWQVVKLSTKLIKRHDIPRFTSRATYALHASPSSLRGVPVLPSVTGACAAGSRGPVCGSQLGCALTMHVFSHLNEKTLQPPKHVLLGKF